jgi:hypothetical protein
MTSTVIILAQCETTHITIRAEKEPSHDDHEPSDRDPFLGSISPTNPIIGAAAPVHLDPPGLPNLQMNAVALCHRLLTLTPHGISRGTLDFLCFSYFTRDCI